MESGVKYKAFRAWRQDEIPGKNVQRERGGDPEQTLDMPSVRVRSRGGAGKEHQRPGGKPRKRGVQQAGEAPCEGH